MNRFIVATGFVLALSSSAYTQCNGCPVPGSQQSTPLLMPGTALSPQTPTNPYPGGYGNGYTPLPPLGIFQAPKRN
jgi:hypothetical protein